MEESELLASIFDQYILPGCEAHLSVLGQRTWLGNLDALTIWLAVRAWKLVEPIDQK